MPPTMILIGVCACAWAASMGEADIAANRAAARILRMGCFLGTGRFLKYLAGPRFPPGGLRSLFRRRCGLPSNAVSIGHFVASAGSARSDGVGVAHGVREKNLVFGGPPDRPSAGHPKSCFARLDPTRGRDKKRGRFVVPIRRTDHGLVL